MIKCCPQLVDEAIAEPFHLLRVRRQFGEELNKPLEKEVVVVIGARDGCVEKLHKRSVVLEPQGLNVCDESCLRNVVVVRWCIGTLVEWRHRSPHRLDERGQPATSRGRHDWQQLGCSMLKDQYQVHVFTVEGVFIRSSRPGRP